jgi:hypothetical protein
MSVRHRSGFEIGQGLDRAARRLPIDGLRQRRRVKLGRLKGHGVDRPLRRGDEGVPGNRGPVGFEAFGPEAEPSRAGCSRG